MKHERLLLSLLAGVCAASGAIAQVAVPERITVRSTLGTGSTNIGGVSTGIASKKEEPETNVARAERLLQETQGYPKEKKGAIKVPTFKRLWQQGLKDLFAKDASGKLVQIREFDEKGALRDLVPNAGSVVAASDASVATATISKQLDGKRYIGTFSKNPTQTCAIDIPGPVRADGDRVPGRYERVGVLRVGSRNLAHYRYIGLPNTPVSKDGEAVTADTFTAADIQSVYNAFRAGQITFTILDDIPMPCLTCEGTGREFDEEKIKEEAQADFESNYNYSSSDTLHRYPKKPYEHFYQEAKKKAFFTSKFCPDCRGKKAVPVKVFVKYSAK